MSDYIKREDAIKTLEGWKISGEMILATVPPADVVEVVRCKDCKYWQELLPVCERIHRAGWGVNDYCSYGERADK